MHQTYSIERVNTVVVGGGQAGLSVGYHLKRLGMPFVILDASQRIGDVWRRRWGLFLFPLDVVGARTHGSVTAAIYGT